MNYKFRAILGEQWGKKVYVTTIPYLELEGICRVDPEVQRKADMKRVEEIAKYILDGFKPDKIMTGFNAIVTSLRHSTLAYDEDSCIVEISARAKLFISDGQHRVLGIIRCIEMVEKGLDEARENDDTEALEYWEMMLKHLERMKLSVLIFTNLTKSEEQQLFHDLNNLGVSVNQTQALSLDQNDMYNRIAKQLENEISLLKKHGINKSAKTLSDKNKEVATLGVWNTCNRILLNGSTDAEIKKEWNEKWDYEEQKNICKEFWITIFSVLPNDFVDKEKYLITKSAYLQGIAAFGHKLIFENKEPNWKNKIIKLQGFNWTHSNDSYARYGGGSISIKEDKKTGINYPKFYFKGTRAAIKSVAQVLDEYISK